VENELSCVGKAIAPLKEECKKNYFALKKTFRQKKTQNSIWRKKNAIKRVVKKKA
jgi:hypothetical protein